MNGFEYNSHVHSLQFYFYFSVFERARSVSYKVSYVFLNVTSLKLMFICRLWMGLSHRIFGFKLFCFVHSKIILKNLSFWNYEQRDWDLCIRWFSFCVKKKWNIHKYWVFCLYRIKILIFILIEICLQFYLNFPILHSPWIVKVVVEISRESGICVGFLTILSQNTCFQRFSIPGAFNATTTFTKRKQTKFKEKPFSSTDNHWIERRLI